MSSSKLEWWAYVMIVLTIFFVCLILNFVVKKINDFRIKERFLRLQKKTSRNRCTQVQEPVPIESSPTKTNKQPPSSPPEGISLIYNKEDNLNNAHGKSEANPPNESNSASQSKIDAPNSKLNFLGAIYKGLPPKEVNENPQPMQICDSGSNSVLKEIMDIKGATIFERNCIKKDSIKEEVI